MRNLAVILIGLSNAACWGAPFQASADAGRPNVMALAAPGAVTTPPNVDVDVDAGTDAIDSGTNAIDSAPNVDAGNSWPSEDCEFTAAPCDDVGHGYRYTCATDAGTIYVCVLAYMCVRFDRYDQQCNKFGIGSGLAWACPIDISATGSGMLDVCDIAIQGDGTRATPSTISCCYSR